MPYAIDTSFLNCNDTYSCKNFRSKIFNHMCPDRNNSLLNADSRSALDLWIRLRAHQQPQPQGANKYVVDLLNMLENTQREWRQASIENAQYKEMNERLRRENKNFEQELGQSNKEIIRLNSDLASVQTSNQALQEELNAFKKLVNAAKAEIQGVSFILPPAPNEDIQSESRIGKRRSNSLGVLPDKRIKRREDNMLEQFDEEEEEQQQQLLIQQTPKRSTMRNRSMSESRIFEDKKEQLKPKCLTTNAKCNATSTMELYSPMIGFGSGWTKGRPVELCDHNFAASSNLFSVAFSYCNVCTRSLGIRCLKCNDCKLQLHENCRHNAPMPCVPIVQTPQRSNSKQRVRLADLCPNSQPKIPGQLIRAVFALERGFLRVVGIYRVPGCDSEVKKLYENFNSKYVPKLDQLDPETITGFIKKFLRDLREPLIPFSSFKEFHTAAVNKDEAQLKYAIETLPIPNRDTLAFMCAHWQKVAMRSNENQMPLENLAKVLGPTVSGTTSKLTHGDASRANQHYAEAKKQVEILLALLQLEHDYWVSFYNQPATALVPQQDSSASLTPRGCTLRRHPAMRERQ